MMVAGLACARGAATALAAAALVLASACSSQSASTPVHRATALGTPVTAPMSGIGDEAYYDGYASLSVLRADDYVRIAVGIAGNLGAEKTLAREATYPT